MNRVRQVLIGVATDPLIVGAARAALLYLLPIAAAAGLAYVQGWSDPRYLPLVPFLVALIRAFEAAADKSLKPRQNQVNPPPVAGSGGGDPSR
jgi:hypothetical protein